VTGHNYYADKLRQLKRRRAGKKVPSSGALRVLERDGVVLLPGFVSGTTLRSLLQEVSANTSFLAGEVQGNVVERNGRFLWLNPERELPQCCEAFFDSPKIRTLCTGYLGRHAVPSRPAVQLKSRVDTRSIVDFFHIDEWRFLMSAFLFLEDVGDDTAPMIYMKRSHRFRLWRIRKEQDFYNYYRRDKDGEYANEESPYSGCVLPTDARRLAERHGYEEMRCTGPAGSLLLFDNLGLHRATPLLNGRRLILSTYWTIP
jgi:hypothetical protein